MQLSKRNLWIGGLIVLLMIFWVIGSCARQRDVDYAPNEQVRQEAGVASSSEREKKVMEEVDEEINVKGDKSSMRSEGYGGKKARKDGFKAQEPEAPKRIYTAKLSLEARNIKETQAAILKVMDENKGFLQTQAEDKMVIRVPAKNFEGVVEAIGLLGILLDKKISTYDVSAQYADIERRLTVARKSRDRLQALLAVTQKVKEKVKIIEEIKRLTRLIEAYERSKGAMDSYIQYSLIEIYLSTPAPRREGAAGLTPFGWINRLEPGQRVLKGLPFSAVEFKLPEGFILFDKEDSYLARSAGGSFVRASEVVNEPAGDGKFWLEALKNGMQLKNYKLVSEGVEGKFYYAVFEYQQLNPFYYVLVLEAKEDLIRIVEGYLVSEAERKLYQDALIGNLKTLKLVE